MSSLILHSAPLIVHKNITKKLASTSSTYLGLKVPETKGHTLGYCNSG